MPATAKSDAGILVLRHAGVQLILDAEHGGAIREFSCGRRQVLRPAPSTASSDAIDLACFPMVPYVNRIAEGRFRFGGR